MHTSPRQIAIFLTCLALPLALLHSRAGSEIVIIAIDALFLATQRRNLSWAFRNLLSAFRNLLWAFRPWAIIALVWWAWDVFCSLPAFGLGVSGWHDFIEAILVLRFIILIAALDSWVLTTPRAHRLAWLGLALSCLWIGAESWQQFLTGSNIFGDHRWPDGSLTGPFWEPRAGAPFAHLLCAALLPVAIPLLSRKSLWPRAAGIALAVLALATTILIGQRMPTMLALLSLLTACLFLPRLRAPAAIAIILGAALLAATPIISPPTYAKLVLHFIHQMRTFLVSPYGELYTRAVRMGLASPLHGFGFNGFKTDCPLPQFSPGFPSLGIKPTTLALAACNIHPHNFYLQALADTGFPGLFLFAALNLAWLIALSRRLWRAPDPLRVGLFAGVLTYAWPLASTDSFFILPHIGWLLYMLGLGLGLTHIPPNSLGPEQKHA
jgi:O-antigen ligase